MGKTLREEDLKLNYILNGDPAKKELGELDVATRKLKDRNKELETEKAKLARAGKEDEAAYKRLTIQIEKNNAAITQNERRMDMLRGKLGLASMTMRELKKESAKLYGQMNNSIPGTKQWYKYRDRLQKVKAQMAQLRTEAGLVGNSVQRMQARFSTMMGKIAVWTASITGLVFGLKKIFDVGNRYEEIADNTQALTKLSDESMQYLKNASKETSTAIVEGNVRIRNSATEIMDAYTIMGSKRPELLKVKEDLHGVTQEAMILSAASKEDLTPSVEALAISLNQFEYGADQARRVINVLAAGSQAGAGNIAYLNQAVEKSGTTFALMGMSIEDNVAAIETIAPYYARAEMAGNTLDKALLKLTKNQIGYKDGVFDLNRAIDELEVMFANGTSAQEIFGVEHAKVGELLVKNKDKFREFQEQVTGSNVAIEQAATNTDNANTRLAQAKNNLEVLTIELRDKLMPVFTGALEGFNAFLGVVKGTISWISKYKFEILAVGSAFATYWTVLKLATIWQQRNNIATKIGIATAKLQVAAMKGQKVAALAWAATQALVTGNLKKAKVAMRALNMVTKANPYVLIASVLAAAAVAAYTFSKKLNAATAAQKALNEVSLESKKAIISEKMEMEKLMAIAKDETLTKKTRLKALKKLRDIAPGYLGDLTLEKINTDEAKKSTDKYIESLEKAARVKALDRALDKVEDELVAHHGKGVQENISWYEQLWNGIQTGGNVAAMAVKNAQTASENYLEKENELLSKKNALLDQIKKAAEEETQNSSVVPVSGDDDPVSDKSSTDATKEELAFLKAQNDLKNELRKAGYQNLKDGIEKEKALENQRWIEERENLEGRLLEKKNLTDEEIAYNDNVYALIEEKKLAHLTKMDNLEKAEEERKAMEKAIKEEEAAMVAVLEAETDEEKFQAELELAQQRFDTEFQQAEGNRMKQLQAKKNYEKAVEKINQNAIKKEEERLDKRKAIGDAVMDIMAIGLNKLKQNVGEETALGKALFIAEQAMAIGRIWFHTSIANAKTRSAYALIPGGSIIAEGIVANNRLQAILSTALVAAQTLAGFEDGGYTDVVRSQDGKKYRAKLSRERGYKNQPTALVGENGPEFVANNAAVQNPTVRPILDLIDAAQRSGEIYSLNLPAVIGSMPSSRGYENGGYTQPVVNVTNDNADLKEMIGEVREVLSSIKENGIQAEAKVEFPLYGRNGFADQMKKVEKFEKSINYK